MEDYTDVREQLESAFAEIQMPRDPVQLRNFVVGQHATPARQYMQCVLELQGKLDAIDMALIDREMSLLKIAECEAKGTRLGKLEADKERLGLRMLDRAILGAKRELAVLYQIWQGFGKQYTREELDADAYHYWARRITCQANRSIGATGRIDTGNAEVLEQLGIEVGSDQNGHVLYKIPTSLVSGAGSWPELTGNSSGTDA